MKTNSWTTSLQVCHLCSFSPHALSRKEVHYLYNVRFHYLQDCNQYVFTTQYDKSSLKMYLDEYIQMFNAYYKH